jgi:2-polyprenyl-3-methyl-5-hydroxy-6-metoxy-1,4-benzoquinol methylase
VDQHHPRTRDGRVRVVVQDLDEDIAFDVAQFDVLLMLDIIEHLKNRSASSSSFAGNSTTGRRS